jgi:hypothetical protein
MRKSSSHLLSLGLLAAMLLSIFPVGVVTASPPRAVVPGGGPAGLVGQRARRAGHDSRDRAAASGDARRRGHDRLLHPYTYTSPGTFTVTLVATNTAGTDSVAHPVAVACVDLTGVSLAQVTTGTIYTGTLVTLRADVVPNDANKPYTYTVDFGVGAGPPALSSDDPLTLTYTYVLTGTYDVAIAVWNCDMTIPVTDTLQVTVVEREEILNYLYLPVVLKNF